MFDFLSGCQKALRRIHIQEISGELPVPEGESPRSSVQEVEKKTEEESSPLSMSPSAKMIKIEEMTDAASFSSSSSRTSDEGPSRQPAQEETSEPPAPSSPAPLTETDVPPPPASTFQLESDLRRIRNQPELVYRYLRVSFKSETLHGLGV